MRRLAPKRLVWLLALAAAPAVCAPAVRAQAPPDSAAFGADFDAMWTFVADDYAYPERVVADWPAVRRLYRPEAVAAPTRRAFVGVLERALAELADAHAHLGTNTPESPRLVPSGSDVRAEWNEVEVGIREAFVRDVRAGSEAERTGLLPSARIDSLDGRSIREATDARLPRTRTRVDEATDNWALNAALAGRHGRPVRLVLSDGQSLTFTPGETQLPDGLLTFEVRPDSIGVVRILNSLGDARLIAAWDSALVALRGTRGLILDLRDTPGGGNTVVARGLMGRLVADERPYQRHERPSEERETGVRHTWLELVSPRGPFTYTAPVAVAVGPWTASMGEGIAIGLDGMCRAAVTGLPMAGLLGALGETRLPNTGIVVRIPTERLTHVEGYPREAFMPSLHHTGDAVEYGAVLLRLGFHGLYCGD